MPSFRKKEKIATVECPFCKKGKVDVTFIEGYVSWNVSRIASGSKRTKYFHEPRIKIHSKCSNCGKSKTEIKDALETGKIGMTHEERIAMLKKRGLPLRIESKRE